MARKPKEPRERKPRKTSAAPPPAIGHNGHNDPDAVQAAFLRHNRQWIQQQVVIDAAKAQQKSIEKAAQLEGVEPKCFKDAQKLASGTGERDLQRELERRLGVARWLGLPVGTQMSMFAQPAAASPSQRIAEATSAGKAAGLGGASGKPPSELGQDEQQAWMAGWHDGQTKLSKGFKRHDPTADLVRSMQPGSAAAAEEPAPDERDVGDEEDVEQAGQPH